MIWASARLADLQVSEYYDGQKAGHLARKPRAGMRWDRGLRPTEGYVIAGPDSRLNTSQIVEAKVVWSPADGLVVTPDAESRID